MTSASDDAVVSLLRARRGDVAAKIAALATNGIDKPDTQGAGLQINYEAHKAGLYAELKQLDEAIQRLDSNYNGFVESETLG